MKIIESLKNFFKLCKISNIDEVEKDSKESNIVNIYFYSYFLNLLINQ